MNTPFEPPRIACFAKTMSIVALMMGIACTKQTRLAEYTAKNKDEAEIVSVLIRYRNAKNRFDLDPFLECLHETGDYSFKGASLVSKATLKAALPGFWTTLQSDDRCVLYTLSHEFVTGDFYLSGWLTNPRISISGDTAHVTVTFVSGWWRQEHYVSMIRIDRRWLINRLEWEAA